MQILLATKFIFNFLIKYLFRDGSHIAEGYSIKLVNSFIKELKISGNVFDPFSGSGTTLLSARNNNLDSFGIDVNPISVLVAKIENDKYSMTDIEGIKIQIETIKALEGPKQEYQTAFNLAHKTFNKDILQSLLHFKKYIKSIQNEKNKRPCFCCLAFNN